MIFTLLFWGFVVRVICTIIWVFNHQYNGDDFNMRYNAERFVPTKSQASRFYLIPFYWWYWGVKSLISFLKKMFK